MQLTEVFEYADLLSVYQELLPPSQRQVLQAFYFDNIGLSEQSEIKDVTKQAIKDCLNKGQKTLKKFESELGLCAIIKRAKANLHGEEFKKIFTRSDS